jgi:hypothetical protein
MQRLSAPLARVGTLVDGRSSRPSTRNTASGACPGKRTVGIIDVNRRRGSQVTHRQWLFHQTLRVQESARSLDADANRPLGGLFYRRMPLSFGSLSKRSKLRRLLREYEAPQGLITAGMKEEPL